jgi:hypothetical protein
VMLQCCSKRGMHDTTNSTAHAQAYV